MATFQVKVLQEAQDEFEPEIRRFTIGNEAISYEALKVKIENIFTDIQGKEFDMFWIDDEKDEVKITSDKELGEAVGNANGQVVKMVVKITNEKREEPCKGCENKGVMFKCSVCPDFLLCGECTTSGVHNEHQVVRIEMADECPLNTPRGTSRPFRGMMGPRGGMVMGPRGAMARGRGGMFNPRGGMIGPRGRMPMCPRGSVYPRGGHFHRGAGRMDPRDGMMGPRRNMPIHPGREQMFGPRDGMMGPRDGMMGPRDRMMPPRNGMMGPRDSMFGPRDMMMGPRDGMVHPRDRMMPSRDGMTPPRDGMMGAMEGMMGPMGGMMGPSEGMPEVGMPGDHGYGCPRFMVPCV